MKKTAYIIPVLLAAFILTACLELKEGYSSTSYDSSFGETDKFTSVLDVTQTLEPVHFRGIINLERGSCSLVITKPGGEIAREYHFDSPGRKNLIADFNAVKGRWKLKLSSENAKGTFRIHWDNKEEDS